MNQFSRDLILFKPDSAGKRSRRQLEKSFLAKTPFIKNQLKGKKGTSGRNNSGKITVFHKGGGNKKKYRTVLYNRNFLSTGIVTSLEYDPYRNALIASVFETRNKDFFYIIAPKNLKVGDVIHSGSGADVKLGNSLPVENIPIGSYIHNVTSTAITSAKFSRSAGTFCYLNEKTSNFARITLRSGEQRKISLKCHATVGIVSNECFLLIRKSKAGQSRWLNKRPTVRGVAMNPIDHPHGGGEGKKSGKGFTPWGRNIHGGRTSKSNNKFVIKHRYE